MKQLPFAILLTFSLSSFVFSQNLNPNHANYYRKIPVIIENECSIKFDDAVAKFDYAKMEVEIENKTADFIIYRMHETVFKYNHGTHVPDMKTITIEPNDKKSKTIRVDGDSRFHVDTFEVAFKGLYQVAVKGVEQKAADFQVPASKNEFDAGPFHLKLGKVKQKTDETSVQFECTYNGDKVGVVNPLNLVIKIENGTEFANDNKWYDMEVLEKGETTKFTATFHIPGKIVDMQFATMHIVWKNTFVESSLKAIKEQNITFIKDPGMTSGKN